MDRRGLHSTVRHPTVHHESGLAHALAAYRGGLTADLLQARIDGQWGPTWSVPACSPEALERAGRQFTRCRAQKLRHCRCARLRHSSAPSEAVNVMVMTEFPGREQYVIRFDGVTLRVSVYLEDDALAALAASFSPPRP